MAQKLSPYEKYITEAIFATAQKVGGKDKKLAEKLAEKVLLYLSTKYPKKKDFTFEEIDDAIEKVLIEEGHAATAKVFILERREKTEEIKKKELLGVVDDLGLPLNCLIVLKNKYLQKNGRGRIKETPKEMFLRVAKAVAAAEVEEEQEKWAQEFFKIMENLEFLPGGRTLANAGTGKGQLANCFVLPMEDNIEEIFESIGDSAVLKKHGGGVGFSFSKIRPKGDTISTGSGACGPVALMRVLDSASEILLQEGGRRSGNMVVLSVTHPDVLDFITCKEDDSSLAQINYSLGVTSRFMEAVEKDKNWDLINPRTGKVVNTLSAQSIFDLAASHAWKNGDPGLVFLDRINRDNPTPALGPIEAVNLCGEQPLLPYEACNLGSINLTKFLKQKANFGLELEIDWKHLEEVVRIATSFLDDVIDICRYPLPRVDRLVKGNRKIGLGIMGWADVLVKMSIAYNSEEALKLANRVMKFINNVAHEESQKLGKEKGSFPNFENSRWRKRGFKSLRNATCTTIAPTGSISMVAGVSSGIEPLYALSYYKEVFQGTRFPEINKTLMEELSDLREINKNLDWEKIQGEIIRSGSIKHLKEIPMEIKRVFVTAGEIPPSWHVKMQAAFQKYTDNAVSKTINLKNEATVEDVKEAFTLAWKLGCKGITIYRDKSRSSQVLHKGNGKEKERDSCPTCGGNLVRGEGCLTCPNCGFSLCLT